MLFRKKQMKYMTRLSKDERFTEVMEVLLEFAEKLRLIVRSMTGDGNEPTKTVEKETAV